MNIERLKELREEIDQCRAVADDRGMSTGYEDDLLTLIDAENARQTATSEDVQEAIELLRKLQHDNYDFQRKSYNLFREIEEQRKTFFVVFEQQQFVLDVIKDWAYSERKARVGYAKARMAIQALIKGTL